jgi:hypothetical protein
MIRLYADTVAGVSSYYWTGPNNFTSTVQNPVISNPGLLHQGVYSAFTVSGQCTSAVSNTTVTILSSPTAASNSPICESQTLTLTTTLIPGATYSWTGPHNFASSLPSPTIANATLQDSGTYSVLITTSGCGAIGPYTTRVNVNPTPPKPTITNNSPVCAGNLLNFTANSFAGATYACTYTLVMTAGTCASPSNSMVVVVNNVPATPIASSNGPLCVGQNLNLSATTVAGTSYQWTGPNGFSSTLQNPSLSTVTLAEGGIYSVTTVANGCSSNPSITSVAVTTATPSATVGSNGPLCPGQNLQLTASTIAGASYSWTGPNSFSSSLQNPVIDSVTANHAGQYSVTTTVSGCAASPPSSSSLIITPLPSAPVITGNAPVCEGQSLSLSASNIAGATYHWTGPDSFASTDQTIELTSITKLKAGTYSVYADVDGCGASAVSNEDVVVRKVPGVPAASSNQPVCDPAGADSNK